MVRLTKSSTRLFIIFWLILVLQILSTFGEEQQKNIDEKPGISKILLDTIGTWKNSHQTNWQKIKSIIHKAQLQFFPPNFESKEAGASAEENGAQEKMKVAVEKSFEASKETVEESAKSAANLVGEAVRKTAEKVKDDHDSHDEL